MAARWGTCVVVLVAVLAGPARGADWPRFRGPEGQGVSAATGLPSEWGQDKNLVWKTELPGAGTSSPVIVGERIYLTCWTGFNVPGQPRGDSADLKRHLLCLDRGTGRTVWTRDEAARLPEQETIREGHGYASSTPAADERGVVVFYGKSGVVAYNHEGKKQWQTGVGDGLNGWGSAASPVLYKDLVLVNASVESGSLVALNRQTGREVWRAGGIRESWNTPVVVELPGGRTEVVVAIFGKVLGFDPATGESLWSCATDIGWYMVPSLVVRDGVVYCIGGRGGGGALAVRAGGKGDVTGSHRLWTLKKGSNVSSPVLHEGHLYWINDSSGVASCVEAETGKEIHEERIPRAEQVYASALVADGKVYYVDRVGRTHVVAAGPRFALLASNDLRDRSTFNASPAAVDGRLYLRSDRFLYCLGKQK